MGVRYIGSKVRVSERIVRIAGVPRGDDVFVDGFCGTGAVASAAADRGWPVRVNDHLASATIMTAAALTAITDAPFTAFGGYHAALDALNSVTPYAGFVTREYSPASALHGPAERRYFTEVNAARIDATRAMINEWRARNLIHAAEERLLLADLLTAANSVANIAGTYGCFLRHWVPAAMHRLTLMPRPLRRTPVELEVHLGDVTGVPIKSTDVAYFDPPYTKRQYAAYYHILETIAAGDQPTVEGITGLRPWRHLASDFCYRARALSALSNLLRGCPAERVLLSYSSEGHIARVDLEIALGSLGDLTVHNLGTIGRYRPNSKAVRAGESVHEYLFDLRKKSVSCLAEGTA